MLKECFVDDRRYLLCDEISRLGIKHGFTFKSGGVSKGKIEGLNLGFRVGDNENDVIKNYILVSKDLGLDFKAIVTAKQTHKDNIRIVTEKDKGKGVTMPSDIEDTDGLITNEKNVPLVVFSADCYGVLLADKEKKAVGAVHSGWRGTQLEISSKAVALMEAEFGVCPENIVAAIGPGIDSCCFETEEEVAALFDKKIVLKKNNGKYLINLPEVIKESLVKSGVREENIYFSKRCSVCESDKFYSYRVHKEKTGRMGAFISL